MRAASFQYFGYWHLAAGLEIRLFVGKRISCLSTENFFNQGHSFDLGHSLSLFFSAKVSD